MPIRGGVPLAFGAGPLLRLGIGHFSDLQMASLCPLQKSPGPATQYRTGLHRTGKDAELPLRRGCNRAQEPCRPYLPCPRRPLISGEHVASSTWSIFRLAFDCFSHIKALLRRPATAAPAYLFWPCLPFPWHYGVITPPCPSPRPWHTAPAATLFCISVSPSPTRLTFDPGSAFCHCTIPFRYTVENALGTRCRWCGVPRGHE